MSQKTVIAQLAASKGVSVSYSGKENTMFVKSTDEKKAKAFVTICNFKGGRKVFGFSIKAN